MEIWILGFGIFDLGIKAGGNKRGSKYAVDVKGQWGVLEIYKLHTKIVLILLLKNKS